MSSQPARAFRPLSACCPLFPRILAPSVCFTFVSRLVAPPCFLPFPVRSSAFPSRMLRFHRNLPALSALFPPLPACCPLFQLFPPLSACLPICPRFLLLPSCLAAIQKKPSGIALGGLLTKNGGYLLSPGCAVPSARAGLTSLFGMGRGGTPPP